MLFGVSGLLLLLLLLELFSKQVGLGTQFIKFIKFGQEPKAILPGHYPGGHPGGDQALESLYFFIPSPTAAMAVAASRCTHLFVCLLCS